MKVFTQGLAHTVGHVLPVMKNERKQWQTGPWFLGAERCYLFPGDSAMGLPAAARFAARDCEK